MSNGGNFPAQQALGTAVASTPPPIDPHHTTYQQPLEKPDRFLTLILGLPPPTRSSVSLQHHAPEGAETVEFDVFDPIGRFKHRTQRNATGIFEIDESQLSSPGTYTVVMYWDDIYIDSKTIVVVK